MAPEFPRELLADNPDEPDTPSFDSHGLATGTVARQAWEKLLLGIEESIHAKGWDQPSRLFAVLNPTDTEALTGIDASNLWQHRDQLTPMLPSDNDAPAEPGEGTFSTAYAVAELAEVSGTPVDTLWGYQAPPQAAALILAFEGWSVPPRFAGKPESDPVPGMRPSQRPDRVEMRGVHMLTRDGESYVIHRSRGHEPEHDGGQQAEGALVDVLKCCLGVATKPAPDDAVADYLGRLLLERVLTFCQSVREPLRADQGLPQDTVAASRAWAAELDAMTQDERDQAMSAMSLTAITTATAVLCWMVSNHGAGPALELPKPQRKLLKACTQRRPEGDELEVLFHTALRATELCLHDLVAAKKFSPVIGDNLDFSDPYWADEGTLYRRLVVRRLDDQQTYLDELGGLLGDRGVTMIHDFMTHIEWRSTNIDPLF